MQVSMIWLAFKSLVDSRSITAYLHICIGGYTSTDIAYLHIRLGNFVTNCHIIVTQLPTQTTQRPSKIDTNDQKIDTNTMDEGLYATMLHRKKPKKWPKCNHVATPHGSFGSLSLWGRHAIFGGITQNVHKTDKKCKWNVEKVLVKLLILREMLKMRILSIKK